METADRLKILREHAELLSKDLKDKPLRLNPTETNKLLYILVGAAEVAEYVHKENLSLKASNAVMNEKLTECTAVMTPDQRDKVFPVTPWDKDKK